MAVIEVENISYRVNNEWKSLRNQQVYQDTTWYDFKEECGLYQKDNWYVLGKPSIIAVGNSGNIIKVQLE